MCPGAACSLKILTALIFLIAINSLMRYFYIINLNSLCRLQMSGEARRQKRVQGAWANNRAGAAVKATGKPSGVSATKNTSLSTATSWQSKGSAVDGAALTFQHQVCC
jgi:hypothetical protein